MKSFFSVSLNFCGKGVYFLASYFLFFGGWVFFHFDSKREHWYWIEILNCCLLIIVVRYCNWHQSKWLTWITLFLTELCQNRGHYVNGLKYVGLADKCDSYVRCLLFNEEVVDFKVLKCPYGYFWENSVAACKEAEKVSCPTSKNSYILNVIFNGLNNDEFSKWIC